MEDKLRAHMDHLFREVPVTKKSVELKEEILQNLRSFQKRIGYIHILRTEFFAYSIERQRHGDSALGGLNKDLHVRIPRKLNDADRILDEMSIDNVSANITISDIHVANYHVDTVSGDVSILSL